MVASTPVLSPLYRWYVLGFLTVVFTWTLVDRGLLMLMLEPIKQELRLSDTQLGFLTGISFALFYATMGVPISRWSDRGNRGTITWLAMGLWSLTVMSCLFVGNLAQLVAARVAAAVGEAGCVPPTFSLVGDYFPRPRERTRAMTIYFLASPMSQLTAFLGGAVLYKQFGWRMAFFLVGLPGVLIALLAKATIFDPRSRRAVVPPGQPRIPSLRDAAVLLWQCRSLRHLSIAIILTLTLSLGMHPWYVAFLVRSHGMRIGDLGFDLGLIFGLSGIVGVLVGGYASTSWIARSEQAQLRLSSVMTGLLAPSFAAFLVVGSASISLGTLVPLVLVFNFFIGPSFALLQRLVPVELRATTLSLVMLLTNLIGMGLGPQIVGMASDMLNPMLGAESLRYAMLTISGLALWGAFHFWRAGETVTEDLERLGAAMRDATYVAVT
jgi:MFS family permease